MKNCPKCGKEVQDGMAFCPECGYAFNGPTQNQMPASNANQTSYSGGRPTIQNKNIATCILLTIVTCGIYGIIWFISMVDSVNTVCNDDKSNQSGATVFLLSIVTCGIYLLIWFYQAGVRMKTAGDNYGMNISDNSLLYLLLSIFGLGIVSYALLQSDLNKFSM